MSLRVFPYGDRAVMVSFGNQICERTIDLVHSVLRYLKESSVSVQNWRPSYTCILGDIVDEGEDVGRLCQSLHHELQRLAAAPSRISTSPRLVSVPVCYGGEMGPDLSDVAKHHRTTEDAIVRLHSDPVYKVATLGFLPGFPYLFGLPQSLSTPRLKEPRIQVPQGAVGIGGSQTGVYPKSSPGGWRLIGRTPLQLFDLSRPEPSLMRPGDSVTFHVMDEDEFFKLASREHSTLSKTPNMSIHVHERGSCVEVLSGGLVSTIQDNGRRGSEHLGVGQAGWMDDFSPRIANLLVGNPLNSAVIETTGPGLELQFRQDSVVCVTGGDFLPRLDGNAAPMWESIAVKRGSVLRICGQRSGARAYIAIHGGFEVSLILNSASTDVGQGFGGVDGRSLVRSSVVAVGCPTHHQEFVSGRKLPLTIRPIFQDTVDVRFLTTEAASRSDVAQIETFKAQRWTVSTKSNRMGIRLHSSVPLTVPEKQVISEPVIPGTIQLPPSGLPIVLMAEAQTTGGYATMGVVASCDRYKIAQLPPGGIVSFTESALSDVAADVRNRNLLFAALAIHNRKL